MGPGFSSAYLQSEDLVPQKAVGRRERGSAEVLKALLDGLHGVRDELEDGALVGHRSDDPLSDLQLQGVPQVPGVAPLGHGLEGAHASVLLHLAAILINGSARE